MFEYIKKVDWIMIISAFLLVIFGLVSIYSTSLGKNDFLNFKKQIIFFAVSILLLFLFSIFDWKEIRNNPYNILAIYFLCVLLLVGLLFFGPTIRGTKGWYKIGPVTVDPVEITKVILIILLAKYFSSRHVEMYNLKHILLSGVYVFIPSILILRQPNFGSAAMLVALWIGILVISGIKLRHFLLLMFCGILVLASSWFFLLKDYQKERIISFVAPEVEPLGISWNQNQSKIAIGSGGIFGKGFGNGSQARHGFLPEPQNDFIFAAIAEEYGLIGIFVLFSVFLVFIWRIMKIAIEAESNFPRLFASGFIILLVAQLFVHIGMNLGILPVIGISLPLVSYGGSGLLACFICIGILENIKIQS